MSQEEIKQNISSGDISRSLLTLVSANILIFSKMIAQQHNIKRVVWIGTHVDMVEYMSMCENAFAALSNQEAELIFPTYHSFLGSLGLLLTCKGDDV